MAVDRLAQLAVDIVINARRARAQLSNLQRDLGASATATRGLSTAIGTLGLTASGFLLLRKFIREVTEGLRAAFEAGVRLEGQLVSIEKIAQTGNFKRLSSDFFDLGVNLRGVKFEEISQTFRTAARTGLDLERGLTELTKAALLLQITSEDIGSREAAEGIARLKDNLDFEGDVLNLTSAIDKLSDEFITTAPEILKSSARLAGFAGAIGITVPQLTGLVTALLETGASATTVRTTLTRLFTVLSSESLEAGKAIGLVGTELENFVALARTDAFTATLQFITRLRELDPTIQTKALKDLGLASSRTTQVIKLFAVSLDDVQRGVQLASDELETGTSILDKYAKASGTAEARLDQLSNRFEKFKASLIENNRFLNLLEGALTEIEGFTIRAPIQELRSLEETLSGLRNQLSFIDIEIKTIQGTLNRTQEFRENLGATIGGLFTGETIGRELEAIELRGRLADLENLRGIINEKITKLQENQNKNLKDQASIVENIAEKEAQRVAEISKLRNQSQQEFLQNVLPEINAKNAKDALEFQRRRLREEGQREKARLKAVTGLERVSGKFGQALTLARDFDELLNVDFIKANKALVDNIGRLAEFQIDQLFKRDTQRPQFIGLTEAWKQAQLATQKEDPLTREQIAIAQEALKQDKLRNTTLDKILKEKIKIK